MNKMLMTFAYLLLAAAPAFAARHHQHSVPTIRAQAPFPEASPVYLAPLGPSNRPFWGNYGARDEVWGACGHMATAFSCPGN
jgi:hypothetical protein